MKNSIEQQFGMVDIGAINKEEKADEKTVNLELVHQLKEEIDKKVAGRSLENLTQDELDAVLVKYQNIEKALGITEKKIENPIITTKTLEGERVELNIEQTLSHYKELFNNLNLTEWTNDLPETIELTEDQINEIKEQVEKHGFNRIRIMPSVEIQNSSLRKLAEETHKPIEGLEESEQYAGKGLPWLSSPAELDKIKNKNRPEGCYIQLYKDNKEVPNETLDKTYPEARQYQKENNLQGYTLAEYLIFQREFTKENKNHPDHENLTWLTDSEIGDSASSRVLNSSWFISGRRLDVNSDGSDAHGGLLGFRSSAVFEI